MKRSRVLSIAAATAVGLALTAGSLPAQAAGYPFTTSNDRFLDIGPVVYGISIKAESAATQRVSIGGKSTTVRSQWEISEEYAVNKADNSSDDTSATDGDDTGDSTDGTDATDVGDDSGDDASNYAVSAADDSYPELATVHVGYWVARYVASQLGSAEDRFSNGTVEQAAAFYNTVVSTSEAKAKASFTASDAKAARIAAVKKDVLRGGSKAFSYVGSMIDKHGNVAYVHTHKAAIVKALNKKFKHSTLYKGSVKVKFTRDFIVKMGPTKADWDRQLHYTVTVRDTTDKVAYAIDLNTHDGGAYGAGVYKTKY